MAALFECDFPGADGTNYDESSVEVYLADGTEDGQPIGVVITAYGDDAVVPDAEIPALIAALQGYLDRT